MIALYLSVFTLASIGSQTIVSKLLLFITIAHDATLGLMIYTSFTSSLYKTSKEAHAKLLVVIKNRKWEKKFMESVPPLKCYIGYCNFFDKLTSLKLIGFCFNITVNLLMI